MTTPPENRFPFETPEQRILDRTRRDPPDLTLVGYEASGNEVLPIPGDATAPYAHAIGRASSDGDTVATGIPVVQNGEPQRVLTDQLGRIWVRLPGGALAAEIQGNIANDLNDGTSKPVKIGGRAVALPSTGLPVTVGVNDRVDAAFDQNGRQVVIPLGNVANDAPDLGNPIKIGGVGFADPLGAVAPGVANGNRVNASFDLLGKLLVNPQGNVAHDIPDAGNPVKVGARAAANSSAGFAAVATNDRTDLAADPNGRLLAVVQGDIAHDSPDSATSLPVKIGGIAIALNSQAGAAVVGAGDRVQAAFDTAGRQEVLAAGDQAANAATDAGNPVGIGGRCITFGNPGLSATSARRVHAAFSTQGALHVISSPNAFNDATVYVYTTLTPTAGNATGQLVIKAGAGRLRRVVVFNNDPANALFVQLHNTAAVGTIATGTRRWVAYPIPSLGFVEIDFSEADLPFTTGIAIALSTTIRTDTAAAVTGEFSAQYA